MIQSHIMLRRLGSTRISAMQISAVWTPDSDRVYRPSVCKLDAKRISSVAVGSASVAGRASYALSSLLDSGACS
jgi:hypothetical protein